jgi:hypothetical protein
MQSNEVKMAKPFFKSLISFCLILLILPAPSFAFPKFGYLTSGGISWEQGDMRLGRVKLHPGLAFESSYESNILNSADDDFANGSVQEPTDDFVFTVRPSMKLELERATGEIFGFTFEYQGRDEHFLHEGDTQDFFNHTVNGAINLGGPGGRSDVTIGGSWNKSAGGLIRDLNSNIGNRQSNTTKGAFLDALYSLSSIFKVQLNAAVTDRKYQGVRRQNIDLYDLGGSFFWQATAQAAFGVKYNHTIRRYEIPSPINDNSDSDQVYLAMRWEPSTLFYGEIAVGVDVKRFDTFKGENTENIIYQLDLSYRPLKRTHITLFASRTVPDSTFQGIQSLIQSDVKLVVGQALGKKFTLIGEAGLDNSDYRRSAIDTVNGRAVKTRIDNTFTGTATLVYNIQRWLDARARYVFEENMSNFNSNDFLNHIGVLEIAAKY